MSRPSPPNATRSWSEVDNTTDHKWKAVVGLSILLSLSLLVFFYFILPRDEARVFVAGFVTPESKEQFLPRPEFADWKLKLDDSSPWITWGPLNGKDSQSAFNQITTANQLNSFGKELVEQFNAQGKPKDSLIVYIRCLALQSTSGLVLLSPEAVEAGIQTNKSIGIPLQTFLEELKQVQAGNVVVIADICDLTAVPHLGKPRNDIVGGISDALAKINAAGTPLWVISSVDSGQANHVSLLARRTLLQSAVEYSLKKNFPTDNSHLTLADFYEDVLRFSHEATDSAQTPRLFRAGLQSPVASESSDTWAQAQQTWVAQRDKLKLAQLRSQPKPPKSQSTSSRRSRNSKAKLLTMALTGPAITTQQPVTSGTSTPISNLAEATATAKIADSPPDSDTIDKDPLLRFWQVRDELASRKSPGSKLLLQGWSPVDFAVDRWQFLQHEGVRYERLIRMTGQTSIESELTELTKEMAALLDASQIEKTAASIQTLSSRWRNVVGHIGGRNDSRRGWLDPKLLAPDLEKRWQEERHKLSLYMDAATESAHWLNLVLHPEVDSNSAITRLTYELIDQLTVVRDELSKLPTLVDQPSTLNGAFPLFDKKQALHKTLQQSLDPIIKRMADTKSVQLTWPEERVLQVVLSSPLLSYPQRKQLAAYYQLTDKNLNQPDKDGWAVPNDSSWPTLLVAAPQKPFDARAWSDKLDQLTKGSSGSPTDRWLQACYRELIGTSALPLSGALLEMILTISNDNNLYVHNPPRVHRLPQSLTLTIRQRNGVSVDNCWVAWDDLQKIQGKLTVATGDKTLLTPNSPVQIEVTQTDELSLNFPAVEALPEFEELKLTLAFATSRNQLKEQVHQITVQLLPPNSDQIELFVRGLDTTTGELEKPIKAVESNKRLRITSGIRIPALEGAQTRLAMYLNNRSEKKRTFQTKLLAVQTPDRTGNGRVTVSSIRRTLARLDELQVISQVDSLELPAMNGVPATAGELPPTSGELKWAVQKDSVIKQNPAAGLLLEVIELESVDGGPLHPKGKPTYFWIDTLCDNPFNGIVSIELNRDQADLDSMQMSAQVRSSAWDYWGLEKIRMTGHLTDELGQPLEFRGADDKDDRDALPTAFSFEVTVQHPSHKQSIYLSTKELLNLPKSIVLHVDVGGYPRAMAYQWRPQGGQVDSANQAFMWLDSKILLRTASDKTPLELMSESSEFVVPHRRGASPASRGEIVELQQLEIPFYLDFPKSGNPQDVPTARVAFANNPPDQFHHDRDFSLIYSVGKDGRLVVESQVSDHRLMINDLNRLSVGRHSLKVDALLMNDAVLMRKELTVVLDKQPPTAGSIRLTDANGEEKFDLYEDESVFISLEGGADELSPVDKVYFALDKALANQTAAYDEDDLQLKSSWIGEKWKAEWKVDLKADDLPRIGKELYIVARSIDAAGNVQDRHTPASVIWKGSKPPAKNKPAKKEP